jgi:hypothetical protein
VPGSVYQEAGDAGGLQHAGEVGMPVRLWFVHGPRAAFLFVASGNGLLQSALPGVLFVERAGAPRTSAAGTDRKDAGRGGANEGRPDVV